MQATHTIQDDICVVSLKGALDFEHSAKLREYVVPLIEDFKVQTIIFDVHEVDFMDSGGIGVIITSYITLSKRYANFALIRATPSVAHTIELCGLREQVPVFDDLDQAIDYFS